MTNTLWLRTPFLMTVVYSRAEMALDESSVPLLSLLTFFYLTILIDDFLDLETISDF